MHEIDITIIYILIIICYYLFLQLDFYNHNGYIYRMIQLKPFTPFFCNQLIYMKYIEIYRNMSIVTIVERAAVRTPS